MRSYFSGRRVLLLAALVAGGALLGCDSVKTALLEAPDPDILDPSLVNSAGGANAVRLGALAQLRLMTSGSGNAGTEGTWLMGGLLADEWSTSSTFVQNDETDERSISLSNSSVTGSLRAIYRTITAASQSIILLNKYKPTPVSDIGEMYFARGFAQLQLALDFCNGIPLGNVQGDQVTLGTQLLTDAQVLDSAVASFQSAITTTTGTDAASVAIVTAAKIGQARADIALGKFPEAAALVAGIQTTYTYTVTSSLTGGSNGVWNQAASQRRYTVGDSMEGNAHDHFVKNAIPFGTAKDPRLPVAYTISGGKDTTKSQDGITFSRTTALYGQTSSMAVVNGIDARLIEAEASLKASAGADASGMLTILNALRTTPIQLVAPSPTSSGTHPGLTTPVMTTLTDPGTPDSRLDLLFREKAFWTFSRGQRLGDMRRLIRQYGRTADNVFPVGDHYRGGTYGGDVNLPITTAEKNGNPNFSQCTDRNP
ncbi:MAG TPA: hypothetical protein VJN70_14585 [Gemmatimonadaceae bacterium]|nr:hypothetical protein [Gemmatimonadaceae bacterium]